LSEPGECGTVPAYRAVVTRYLEVCPRCDRGPIVTKVVVATDEVVRVCEECDALWPDTEEPAASGFVDLTDFLAERDRSGLWSELAEPRS
jgi:hypothetical protein